VIADRVNCIRKIVRVAGLAVRNGNRLELGRESAWSINPPFRRQWTADYASL